MLIYMEFIKILFNMTEVLVLGFVAFIEILKI